MDISHKIERDGMSTIEITYDFSALNDMGSMFDDGFAFDDPDFVMDDSDFTFEDSSQDLFEEDVEGSLDDTFCDEMFDESSFVTFSDSYVTGCEVISEGVYKVTAEFDVSEYLTVSQQLFSTRFEYDATSIFIFLSSGDQEEVSDTGSDFSDLSIMGGSFKYDVSMPGTLLSHDHGVRDNEKVILDLADLELVSQSIIISEERSYGLLFIFVGVLALILVLIMFTFISKKKKFKPKEDISNLSGEESKCRQYILQYKNSFGRDAIKTSLIREGISSENVDKYLDKYY